MSNVKQFPTEQIEIAKIDSMMADMEQMYTALDEAHKMINELELQCSELEATYDAKIAEIIGKYGSKVLRVEHLRYCGFGEDIIYETTKE